MRRVEIEDPAADTLVWTGDSDSDPASPLRKARDESCVTSDGGTVASLLSVVVLLAVCALLRVLQTQFVTNLEGLAHGPDYPHGLALRERPKTEKQDKQDTSGFGHLQYIFLIYDNIFNRYCNM